MDEAVSLSIDVEEDVQGNFEHFAKLYKYGHFAEAKTWFDECFGTSSWKESFPLAAELAKLFLEQGEFRGLELLTSDATSLFSGSERRLLSLLHALAQLEVQKELDETERPSDRRASDHARVTGRLAARILEAERKDKGRSDVSADACWFEIRVSILNPQLDSQRLIIPETQLLSTSLRIAQSIKGLALPIPSELKYPPAQESSNDTPNNTSNDSPWSAYRQHFAIALAKNDFASAQELLTPLLSLLDSVQGPQLFQEFTNAVSCWSAEAKAYLSDKPSAISTSDYIMAMEPTWLAMANATAHYCKYLSVKVDQHSSLFPFGRRRKIKEIWRWLHQLRKLLMQLELCDPSVVDSRPGLLYKLQVLDIYRLEGRQHHELHADDVLSSANQQRDVLLERLVREPKIDQPPPVPIHERSKGQLLDLLLQLTTLSSYAGVRWTYPTAADLAWQVCLLLLQSGFIMALMLLILLFPGWMAILFCTLGIHILSRLASYRQGQTTARSRPWEPPDPGLEQQRWAFLAGSFTTTSLFQADLDMIANTFGREVYGIRGWSRGWLVDFLFDYASERLGITSRQTNLAYKYMREVTTDPAVDRVILIAHGAGAVAASQALNNLFLEVSSGHCSKLEFYTFGSMARTMNNPQISETVKESRVEQSDGTFPPVLNLPPERVLKTMEHYCNRYVEPRGVLPKNMLPFLHADKHCASNDPIARMGILEGLERTRDNIQGNVIIFDRANGHLFTQHYLGRLSGTKYPIASSPSTMTYAQEKQSGITGTGSRTGYTLEDNEGLSLVPPPMKVLATRDGELDEHPNPERYPSRLLGYLNGKTPTSLHEDVRSVKIDDGRSEAGSL